MVIDTSVRNGDAEVEPLLTDNDDARATCAWSEKRLLILVACGILVLTVDFGFFLSQAPQTAVFEQIICDNYGLHSHRFANVTANTVSPCKSELVQGELALVSGYKDTFETLPSILLSLPYGVLSDHWGRKPVLYLGIIGLVLGETWVRLVCYFSDIMPLRMIWLSGLFRIIGGGDQVLVSNALTMVADMHSEEQRSTALFRLHSCVILAEILATPVSAYLMTFDIVFPYVLSLIVVIIGFLPALILPETLSAAKAQRPTQTDTVSTNSGNLAEISGKSEVLRELTRQLREFKDSTRFIWRDTSICLMIVIMFVSIMSRQSTNLLLQYASKKFDWSLAKASLLISLRGIFSLVTYLALMPAVSFVVGRYFDLHGKHRDRRLSQASGLLSIIGFAAMGLAPVPVLLIWGLVILSLGSSFMITTRSLVTSLVSPDHVGTLYSAIGVSQAIGTFVAGPLFAYLFQLGMHLGDAWMGLPFLQAALFFVVATVAVWRVRVQRSGEDEEQREPLLHVSE